MVSEKCHHKFCRHPEVRAAFGEPRRMADNVIFRGAQERAPQDDGHGLRQKDTDAMLKFYGKSFASRLLLT
jgi:hypothetical protein